MTPQELREKRMKILGGMFYVGPEMQQEGFERALDALEALDEESAPSDTFFDLVNEIDNTRKLLNAAQGNPTRIVMVLDMITAICVRYAETLEKGMTS